MQIKYWKTLRYLLFAGVVMVVLLQFAPCGRDHTNPPTTSEPAKGSLQTNQKV